MTAHTIGVHYRWQIPDTVRDQLRLAHSLREDLVTLQLDYDAAVKAIWSSYPHVAAIEQTLSVAEDEAAAAAEIVSAERIRQRTKRVTGPAADRLAAARAEVKQARQQRRAAIGEVYDQAADRIRQAGAELRRARKALYAKYCQNKHGPSLFWATFNDVADHHQRAINRIKNQRAAGRPAQLRHHRFDGTGTIAVQLQREAGKPPRTPAMLADPNGSYRNVLQLPWLDPGHWETLPRAQQRRYGRTTVRMRCGSIAATPVWVDIPVQQHRMLAAEADISKARLTVTKTAGHLSARLTITANLPDLDPPTQGSAIAVHLGWRDTDTGIQTATWRTTTPITIPAGLQHILTTNPGGTTGTVILPQRVADRLAHTEQLRSRRDRNLDAIRDKLTTWLACHGPTPHPHRSDEALTAGDVARWRAPARIAALAHAWRHTPPAGGDTIAAELETWRRKDRRLWEHQEHARKKTLRHRDDTYRNIAATLTQQTSHIIVDDTSISTIAALPNDLPTEIATRIAYNRTIAAPATLRTALTAAAIRTNTPITVVPAAGRRPQPHPPTLRPPKPRR